MIILVPVTVGGTGIVTRALKKNFGSRTMETFNRFTTKGSYTWKITRNTESTASEN